MTTSALLHPALTSHSPRALRRMFEGADAPSLAALAGRHEGELVGPQAIRGLAPLMLRVTGMGGWCGKSFSAPGADATELTGENLVLRDGRIEPSIALRATIEPSRIDGRPSIVLHYPPGAPWPWPRVTDELRALDGGTMLGLTFGLPFTPAAAAAFVLRRA